jgi:nucleoid-associated protein YgaU
MSRTRVRRRRLGALLIGAGILTALAGTATGALGAPHGSELVARHRYVVRGGDSLWSIAQREVGDADPRPLVDAIVAENQLPGAAIVPGQRLVIPSSG